MPKSDDRYFERRLLGEGASGAVWAVRDRQRGGAGCALKELSQPTAEGEERLRREFATLVGLHHPNLVEVYEFDRDPGTGAPRFSLERIDGLDLVAAVRREGPESLPPLAVEALRALAFLHDFGLLHRDLKPANLLVRNQPRRGSRLVVLDFGLAEATDGSDPRSAPLGTLPYVAPEVFDGAGASRRSDLYALGALLYEAVHGEPPFVPLGNELSVFVEAVRQGRRETRPAPAGYSAGFCAWIDALLATHPTERPASASEALARLNASCETAHPLETRETRAARLASGDPPGREVQLDEIHRLLAAKALPHLIWLVGDAGSGKTRILRSLASRYVGRGWDVLTRAPLDDGDDSHVELHEAVESALNTLRLGAKHRPTLVLLDEADSANSALVHLLRQFAAEAYTETLVIVAALRGYEFRNADLRQLVEDHGLLAGATRVDLPPLDHEELGRVASRANPDQTALREHVDRLFEASEGNPLRAETLLVDGGWESAGPAAGVSATLADSVARRVESLPAPALKWLTALAVLGPGTPATLVSRLAGMTEEQGVVAAGAAAGQHLARLEDGAWSPASRLLAGQLTELLGPVGLAEASAVAARLIEGDDGRSMPTDARHLARLWRRAGDRERALTCALRAAQGEEARGAASEAADWIRFGLLGLTRRDPRRRELRLRHAELLDGCGKHLAAARGFATVLRLSDNVSDRLAILARQSRCLSLARRPRLGLALARRARELEAAPSVATLAAEGLALTISGRRDEALEVLQQAVLARADDPRQEADALALLANVESFLRRMDDARVHLARGLRLARRAGDAVTEGRILALLSLVEKRASRPDAARRALETSRAHAARHRLRSQQVGVLINEAWLLHDEGRFDRAIRHAAEGEPLSLHFGARNSFLQCRLQRADSLIQVGRPAEAAALLERVLDGPGTDFEAVSVHFARLTLAEALLAIPTPDTGRVATLLADLLAPNPHPRLSLFAMIVELERRVATAEAEPFERLWQRYVELRSAGIEDVEPSVTVRALLARSATSLRAGDDETALAAGRSAAELAGDTGFQALAARAWTCVARAAERLGRAADARAAWEAGRQALDQAAARIEDGTMRRDFLAQPVFAALRASRSHGGADQDRLAALYDMIHALNSETDPERLLVSMLDMALRVVGAERGMILLGEAGQDTFVPRVARNLEQETIEDVTQFSSSVVRQAGGGEAVLSVDAGHDQRLDAYKSVSLYGIRSVICVPLRSRGKIIGVVYVDDRSERGLFSEKELKFLQAFADHAGLALENARTRGELERENQRLQVAAEVRVQFANMVGRSRAMQDVFGLIERVAETRLPVLIHGESGTGKELVARAIHYNGPLKAGIFLTENCAAIPETLLESELFGHVKGAFTGADRDRQGLFEQADGGTLFLDEVGDMSPGMQARLLRVLQEGELRRVGGSRTIKVDVRVLAATHRDLQAEVAAGRFREDLLYRLQVLLIDLPPLRERHGDIPLLIESILPKIAAARGRPAPRIRAAVMDLLERHPWPGNVRQLESTLQRLALLAGDGPVTLELLESDHTLRQMLIAADPQPAVLRQENEKDRLVAALKTSAGNRARAAKLLGISRATVFRRIKEHGL